MTWSDKNTITCKMLMTILNVVRRWTYSMQSTTRVYVLYVVLYEHFREMGHDIS